MTFAYPEANRGLGHTASPAAYAASRGRSSLDLRELAPKLFPRILCDFHHRGTQQAVFKLVSALPFFEDLVVGGVGSFDHLDRLMNMRIELFALGGDGTNSQLRQYILQLLIDEFDAGAEVGRLGLGLQRAFEAVDHGQQRLDGINCGKVTKVLLLFGSAPARVFEFGLRASQAIEQSVALGFQLLQFRAG